MLKGKTAIVTGSTSGIGLGIARALGADGANLMLNGFGDAAQIEALRAGLAKEFGVKVAFSGADISKPAQIQEMVSKATQELGSVDILVNNAGIQHTAPVEQFPDDRWDAVIAINLSSNFHAIKAVLPQMKSRNWGRIVNLASVHGLVASVEKVTANIDQISSASREQASGIGQVNSAVSQMDQVVQKNAAVVLQAAAAAESMQANAQELVQLVSVFKLGDAVPVEASTSEHTHRAQRAPRLAFPTPRLVQGSRGNARRNAAGEPPTMESANP